MTDYYVVGIVGASDDKFTELGKQRAENAIAFALTRHSTQGGLGPAKLASGHSPVGGIDIWAEEYAKATGHYDPNLIFAPKVNTWGGPGGFKERNLDIARNSQWMYVIVADKYPPNYPPGARRFSMCYHCMKNDHVKSGGCWTGIQWERMNPGRHRETIIINNE